MPGLSENEAKKLVKEYSGRDVTDVQVYYAQVPGTVGVTAVRCKLDGTEAFSCKIYDDEYEQMGSMAVDECEFKQWPPVPKMSFLR